MLVCLHDPIDTLRPSTPNKSPPIPSVRFNLPTAIDSNHCSSNAPKVEGDSSVSGISSILTFNRTKAYPLPVTFFSLWCLQVEVSSGGPAQSVIKEWINRLEAEVSRFNTENATLIKLRAEREEVRYYPFLLCRCVVGGGGGARGLTHHGSAI